MVSVPRVNIPFSGSATILGTVFRKGLLISCPCGLISLWATFLLLHEYAALMKKKPAMLAFKSLYILVLLSTYDYRRFWFFWFWDNHTFDGQTHITSSAIHGNWFVKSTHTTSTIELCRDGSCFTRGNFVLRPSRSGTPTTCPNLGKLNSLISSIGKCEFICRQFTFNNVSKIMV